MTCSYKKNTYLNKWLRTNSTLLLLNTFAVYHKGKNKCTKISIALQEFTVMVNESQLN